MADTKEWLDGQMMQVPIEDFINLRMAVSYYIEKIEKLESELREAKQNLSDAKEDIRNLIGMKNEHINMLEELQFEKGVKCDVDDGR